MTDKNLLARQEDVAGAMVSVPVDTLGGIIAELMRPVMETMGTLLKNNTAALEQLTSAQSVQNDRLAAVEKQLRLQTPVTSTQVRYLNEDIRARSRELLHKRGVDDDKRAVTRLGNCIRKAVTSRYGVDGLRDVPRHEYSVAKEQIALWNDALTVLDVVKEAREHAEHAGQAVCVDGQDGPVSQSN